MRTRVLSPEPEKRSSIAVHTCNPRTRKTRRARPGAAASQPGLISKFQDSDCFVKHGGQARIPRKIHTCTDIHKVTYNGVHDTRIATIPELDKERSENTKKPRHRQGNGFETARRLKDDLSEIRGMNQER